MDTLCLKQAKHIEFVSIVSSELNVYTLALELLAIAIVGGQPVPTHSVFI